MKWFDLVKSEYLMAIFKITLFKPYLCDKNVSRKSYPGSSFLNLMPVRFILLANRNMNLYY